MDDPSAVQQAERRKQTIADLQEDATTIGKARDLLAGLKTKVARDTGVTDAASRAQKSVDNAQHAAERTLRILEAGFPLVEIPEGWLKGFPAPDPRPHTRTTPRWTVAVSWVLFPILYGLAVWVISSLTEWEWNFTDERIIIFGLAGPGIVAFFLGLTLRQAASSPFKNRNEQALKAVGLPTDATRFLHYPPEAASAVASARDTGHFDAVVAVAPPETFNQTTGGPFWILGVRGKKKFPDTPRSFLVYKHIGEHRAQGG